MYWVTPFETRKLLVKFGYFVATLNLVFFLSLKSKDTSSKSAIVCTSIQSLGTATTTLAEPKSNFFFTSIFFFRFVADSFNRSKPEIPMSRVPSPIL